MARGGHWGLSQASPVPAEWALWRGGEGVLKPGVVTEDAKAQGRALCLAVAGTPGPLHLPIPQAQQLQEVEGSSGEKAEDSPVGNITSVLGEQNG